MKCLHGNDRGSLARCLLHRFRDDKGAISVDFMTLTAAVVGLGIATTASVSSGLVSLSGEVEETLKGDSIISTNFDGAVSTGGGLLSGTAPLTTLPVVATGGSDTGSVGSVSEDDAGGLDSGSDDAIEGEDTDSEASDGSKAGEKKGKSKSKKVKKKKSKKHVKGKKPKKSKKPKEPKKPKKAGFWSAFIFW